jgi:hypothetical protein
LSGTIYISWEPLYAKKRNDIAEKMWEDYININKNYDVPSFEVFLLQPSLSKLFSIQRNISAFVLFLKRKLPS